MKDLKNTDTRDKLDQSFLLAENEETALRVVLTPDIDGNVPSVEVDNLQDLHKDRDITKVGGVNVPTKGTQKVLPTIVFDEAGDQVSSFGGVAIDAEDIAGNDTITYANVASFKALSDGTVKVTTAKGQERTLQVFEGVMEPISITKYWLTGSDVMNIRIYYNK